MVKMASNDFFFKLHTRKVHGAALWEAFVGGIVLYRSITIDRYEHRIIDNQNVSA